MPNNPHLHDALAYVERAQEELLAFAKASGDTLIALQARVVRMELTQVAATLENLEGEHGEGGI